MEANIIQQIEKFAEKIKNGDTQFIAENQDHYMHVIALVSSHATYYYANALMEETEEKAVKLLHKAPREKYELIAIYANGITYLTAPYVWGLLSPDTILPQGVTTLARVLVEAEEHTKFVLLPAFLKKLPASNRAVALRSTCEIAKYARAHLLSDTEPSIDFAFTLHFDDVMNALANNISIETLCKDMLERQKDYYAESLGMAVAIKTMMISGNTCAPWELALSKALIECKGKTVAVTIKCNGHTATGRADVEMLMRELYERSAITPIALVPKSSGENIMDLYQMNGAWPTCEDIVEVVFRGKTIYVNNKKGEAQ